MEIKMIYFSSLYLNPRNEFTNPNHNQILHYLLFYLLHLIKRRLCFSWKYFKREVATLYHLQMGRGCCYMVLNMPRKANGANSFTSIANMQSHFFLLLKNFCYSVTMQKQKRISFLILKPTTAGNLSFCILTLILNICKKCI